MKRLLVALGAIVWLTAGCHVTVHDNYSPPPHRTYVVEETHYHDECCGHVWNGSAYVFIGRVHRHHPGCGHYWVDGRWCVYEPRPVTVVHVHSANCGHVWCDDGWSECAGHVHYEGCGHFWIGGRWCLRRPATVVVEQRPRTTVVVEQRHTCHDGCGHYWDGARWVVVEHHHHGPGCGHVLVNGYWTLQVRVR